MDANKKKKVIVIGSLLVIGGIVGYVLWRRKKDQENALTDTTPKVEETKVEETKVAEDGKPVIVKSTQPIYTKPKPTTTTPTPKPTTTPKPSVKKVSVDDILLKNPALMQGKGIFAKYDGANIYDIMMDKFVGKTRKDEKVGIVTQLKRTTDGSYILKGKTPTGDYFSISSRSVYTWA